MSFSRKPVPPRRRFRILARDRFQCQYCGAYGGAVRLVVDHVIPCSKGGSNEDNNLVTACEECNYGKADLILGDDLYRDPESSFHHHFGQFGRIADEIIDSFYCSQSCNRGWVDATVLLICLLGESAVRRAISYATSRADRPKEIFKIFVEKCLSHLVHVRSNEVNYLRVQGVILDDPSSYGGVSDG